MIVISYDFSSNKRRSKFSKFLKKFGRRFQFSVFEIKNSKRALNNIMTEVEYTYEPHFTNTDSIVIMRLCEGCEKKVKRYGYAKNEEEEVLFFS